MQFLAKLLWSAALHFFKVLACAINAKLATLGPAGSRGISMNIDRQMDIKTDG